MDRIKRFGRLLGTVWAAAAMAGLLCVGSLFGSVVVQMDLEGLVAGADTIVQGRAEAVYSQWDSDRRVMGTFRSIQCPDQPDLFCCGDHAYLPGAVATGVSCK